MSKKLFLLVLLVSIIMVMPILAAEDKEILLAKDGSYKIVVPNYIGTKVVKLDGEEYEVIVAKPPQANKDGSYAIYKIITTNKNAKSISGYPGNLSFGQMGEAKGEFVKGIVNYTIEGYEGKEIEERFSNSIEKTIYSFDFYVLDSKYNTVSTSYSVNIMYSNDESIINDKNFKLDRADLWAQFDISDAPELGLLDQDMLNGYHNQISREDFCKLVVKMISVKQEKSIEDIISENKIDINNNHFTDTKNQDIIIANNLGIVLGKENGIFDPQGNITRQEAAVMLTNAAKVFGVDTKAENIIFNDDKTIADWAKDSVNFVYKLEVMKGVGENMFDSKGTYTRQQSFVTIFRLFNALK